MFDITPGAPAPNEFYCPLTGKIMLQPVVIEDGSSFEKEAILAHFEQCKREGKPFTNPANNIILESTQIFPNKNLQKQIQQFLQDNPQYAAELYTLKPTLQILVRAIKDNQLLTVKNCLKDSHLLHEKDEDGNLPLHVAASLGYSSIVQILIEHGANYKLLNSNGQQADMVARVAGFSELADEIINWHRAYKMAPTLHPLQAQMTNLVEENQLLKQQLEQFKTLSAKENDSLKQQLEQLKTLSKGKEEEDESAGPSSRFSFRSLLPLGTLFQRMRLQAEPLLIAQLPLEANTWQNSGIREMEVLSNGDLALLVAHTQEGRSDCRYEIQIRGNTPSTQAKRNIPLPHIEHGLWGMAALPNMQLALINNINQQVYIINAEDGNMLKTFTTERECKNSYVEMGANNQLLIGRELGCVEIWHLSRGKSISIINPLPKSIPYGERSKTLGITLLTDKLIAVVVGPFNEGSSFYGNLKTYCQLQIFNLTTKKQIKILQIPGDFECMYSLSEDRLVTGHKNGAILIWSVTNDLAPINLQGHLGAVTCLNSLPNGLLVSGSSDNTIRVWELNTGICCHVFSDERACSNRAEAQQSGELSYDPHHYGIKALQVLPNGELLSASDLNSVKRWVIPELVLEQFCEETPGCKVM